MFMLLIVSTYCFPQDGDLSGITEVEEDVRYFRGEEEIITVTGNLLMPLYGKWIVRMGKG